MAPEHADRRQREGVRETTIESPSGPPLSYLLDTNVLSEIYKGTKGDPRVRAWVARAADEDLYISGVVIGELRKGIEIIRRRDQAHAASLEHWVRRLVPEYGDRILPLDLAVAEEWGRLSAVRSTSVIDTLLAATARVHGLTLATRNVRDIAWTGVDWINPFDAQSIARDT